MSDEDTKKELGKGRGTLRDDAAGSSGRPAGTRSWNSVIKRATGGTASVSEDSSSNISEAIEMHAEEHARQKEVSQISGLVPLNEFLAPQEGDAEMSLVDAVEMSGFQKRVLDRMSELRDIRVDMAIELGDADAEVKKIDSELINLKVFLAPGGNEELDGSSVMFDVSQIEKSFANGSRPSESAGGIGPALEAEGMDIPESEEPIEVGAGGIDVGFGELDEVDGAIADGAELRGLGKGAQTPAGLDGTQVWGQKSTRADAINEDTWFQEKEQADEERGSEAPTPARDSMILEETRLLEGVEIIPLNKQEEKLLGDFDKLGAEDLRKMALERRWQVETLQDVHPFSSKPYRDIDNWENYSWYDKILEMLEWEGKSIENAREELTKAFDSLIEQADALETESDNRRKAAEPLQTEEFRGESPRPPKKDAASQRVDTGVLKAGGLDFAYMEGTRINAPKEKKPEKRREEPTKKEMERAGTILSTRPSEDVKVPLATNKDLGITSIIQPLEDFIRYGDIFYAMETVFVESGKKRDVGLKEFAEDLGEAIELAEGIAAEGYTVYDGNLSGASPEMRRVQRLRAFKKEFVDVPETGPKNDIKQYLLWHEMQSATYNKFADVFDTLEISPGEYSRRGILRICDVCLESRGLDTDDTGKVQALKEMLEAKENGGEVDEFAAERIAELNYEMVVGFGTKRERELRKNQVEGILRMEAELKELKFKISTFEQKESQMVDILANLYTNMKKADSKQEGMAKYVPEIRHALMELEPDYREREKYMNALFRALRGEGEIGAWLGKKAKEKLDWELRIAKTDSAEQARYSRKGGGVAKGIGIATLPIVGAAILAGGLWLGQNGITLPFGKGAVEVQKDAAAEVEKETVEGDTEVRLPAGVAEGDAHLDEDIKQDGEKIGVNNDSDVGSEKEEPVEEIQEEPAEESDSVEYERTPEGLEKALDNWCSQREAALKEIQEEAKARGEDRSPFVQTEMIREAYRAIEPQLDGSVNPYDLGDWEKMLLKMKYPNIAVELAIMTDLWSTQIPSEARYAAGIRLSLLLGKRAGRPGKYDFSQAADSARNNGIPLPKIDADTLLGDIEGTGSAVGRCTSASLMRGVLSGMQGYKQEAIDESKASEKAFMKKVTKLLGRGSSRLIKAWENAVEEGKHEARKDVCKTATKDRIGRDGAKSAEKKDGFWKKLSKKRSRKRKEAREEADSITGGMNKGAYEKHGITPPSQKPKGNPNNKKKDGSKESLPDLLKRVHERNTGASKLEKTGKHTGLSYRGGVGAGGNKSTDALRREKSEEYLERFRFRGGVDEKKSFPLKRLASKIGIRKGFERTTAQA